MPMRNDDVKIGGIYAYRAPGSRRAYRVRVDARVHEHPSGRGDATGRTTTKFRVTELEYDSDLESDRPRVTRPILARDLLGPWDEFKVAERAAREAERRARDAAIDLGASRYFTDQELSVVRMGAERDGWRVQLLLPAEKAAVLAEALAAWSRRRDADADVAR